MTVKPLSKQTLISIDMKYLCILISTFLFLSCDNQDDIDYYKSQHRSPDLMGLWMIVETQGEIDIPHYLSFEEFIYKRYTYNESLGEYYGSDYYWYNDAQNIYIIRKGGAIKREDGDSIPYELNETLDTLSVYAGEGIWEKYIRSTDIIN